MNKKALLIFITILSTSGLYAQSGRVVDQTAFKKIEKEKIAFFTNYLELSSREARDFWPVYEEFQNRRNDFLSEKQSLLQSVVRNHVNLQENKAKETADRYIEIQVKEIELVEEFHKKFKAVLPPRKVMLLYQAENEFRMHLLRRLRGRLPKY